MLLTITNSHPPAADLGYLLHKHPDRVQSFELTFGTAHVFYPQVAEDRCIAALLLDINPVDLVRNRRTPAGRDQSLQHYVNDRPYVASSFMSVALAKVFGAAMSGRCKERPELAETSLPLTARIASLPCRGGERFLHDLFEPLGYTVTARRHPLDEKFPDWGASPYHSLELQANVRLCDLLTHLYVLIPVLDDDKHYWVGSDELEKLLRRGEGWLADHPQKERIATRYLKHQRGLARAAIARLTEEEGPDPDATDRQQAAEEESVERPLSLNEVRIAAVSEALKSCTPKRVLDLGCGEGKLLRELLKDKSIEEIVGVDVSHRALEIAERRLRLDRLPLAQQRRIRLLHGSLTYRDARLGGFDAAAAVEVIEHLDPPRLAAFERVLFECARPKTVVVTTPNVEYNVRFESLPAGRLRHRDHRFEWTRAEFRDWAHGIADRFGYTARFQPIGPEDPEVGAPTQMGVFINGGR